MRIQKIIYKEHPFFSEDFVINFENNWKIADITYLVGDNWSWKTQILDNIAEAFSSIYHYSWYDFSVEYYLNLTAEEKIQLWTNTDMIFRYKIDWNNLRWFKKDLELKAINEEIFNSLAKVIVSNVEVNFKYQAIKNVTAKEIDIELPKEISKDLNVEIPQLLVDISTMDDAEFADWWRSNPKWTFETKPSNIWTRLDRFIKGFNKIYNWSKIFKKVDNINQEKVILFTDAQWRDIDISKFSSWEQQVLYRVWYLLKNLWTIKNWIILIDEPEISLHPIWQERFRELLVEIFNDMDVQFIIATHSPYLFRNMNNEQEQAIKIDSHNNRNEKLVLNFPWTNYTPSPNYISYVAYNIANYELHIELYEQLLIKYKKDCPKDLDNYLESNLWIQKDHTFIDENWNTHNETLMTWIRNKIHHGNNTLRPDFNDSDLKDSVNEMIRILKQ